MQQFTASTLQGRYSPLAACSSWRSQTIPRIVCKETGFYLLIVIFTIHTGNMCEKWMALLPAYSLKGYDSYPSNCKDILATWWVIGPITNWVCFLYDLWTKHSLKPNTWWMSVCWSNQLHMPANVLWWVIMQEKYLYDASHWQAKCIFHISLHTYIPPLRPITTICPRWSMNSVLELQTAKVS